MPKPSPSNCAPIPRTTGLACSVPTCFWTATRSPSEPATISDHVEVRDGKLEFGDKAGRAGLDQALGQLDDPDTPHAPIELHGKDKQVRLAYLVAAENLPAVLKHIGPGVRFGLLVAEPQSAERVRRLVQTSFNLANSEVAVAMRLTKGPALKETARVLKISPNTARNHLQSIFDKTGLNRQTDLILMLTQLSVLLSAVGQSDTSTTKIDYPDYRFCVVPNREGTGRRLAYRGYADGENEIVYFHGSVSPSRLVPETEPMATALDLTIIAPDRPGSGFSDPLSQRDFQTTAHHMRHLMDELEIPGVELLGFMSGAAHALATASLLQDRVEHVMLVAGRAPARYATEDRGSLAVLRRRPMQKPWLLETLLNILCSRAAPGPISAYCATFTVRLNTTRNY